MSERPIIQTGHVSWSPDYDSKKPAPKLSELDSSPCSASGKRPARIVTDPREVHRIYSKPSTVTHEEAVRSILVQNGKLPPKQNGEVKP